MHHKQRFTRRPVRWLPYLDGRLHELGPEVYGDNVTSARTRVHAAARRKDTKVQTRIMGDRLWVQVVPGCPLITGE